MILLCFSLSNNSVFLATSITMVPIRIGIIGLSLGAWAANAHLPYLQSPDSKFEIVAVCNSSVKRAAKSVKELGLAEGVEAASVFLLTTRKSPDSLL